MDKIVDEIVFMIFDNNIINNPNDTKIFFNKLISKLKMKEFDSINIEETESESSDEEEPNTSDEEFILDTDETSEDENISDLEAEEIKIIVKEGFSEIK
jgi:hypothetical protein